MWIAIPVVLLTVLIIGPLIIAFGGFTVDDTMPSEEDYNYADDEVQS